MPRVNNTTGNIGNTKHGLRNSTEYKSWCAAKGRCFNVRDEAYPRYGGRGITMCEKWRNSFSEFLSDMGHKPTPDHSLDRIDTNGDYTVGNCRWATITEQARNRRNTVRVAEGVLAEVAEDHGVKYKTLHRRLKDGRPLDVSNPNVSLWHRFEVNGSLLTLSEIASLLGKPYHHVYHRVITKRCSLLELMT